MAKTQWVDGEHITPAQMIAFFGNTAGTGHFHNGQDFDGNCPKVILGGAAQVTGILPLANYESPSTAKITDIDSGTVGGKIPVAYLTVEQTATLIWVKVINHVTLYIPQMIGTSNAVTMEILPATAWPAAIIPSSVQYATCFIKDNNVWKMGQIRVPVAVDGNFICAVLDGGHVLDVDHFTAANTKGIENVTISYYTD